MRACWCTVQAKKIDEIHAEAHAELGMVPTPTLPLFQALPALPASILGPREKDFELFPAFRGEGTEPRPGRLLKVRAVHHLVARQRQGLLRWLGCQDRLHAQRAEQSQGCQGYATHC